MKRRRKQDTHQAGGGEVRLEGLAKTALETSRARLLIAGSLFALAFALIAVRLLDIAAFQGLTEPRLANTRPALPTKSGRAPVVDRNGLVLATSLQVPSLIADPKKVTAPRAAAEQLKTVLTDIDVDTVVAKLSADSRFAWIQRGISPKQKHAINQLGIPGLDFLSEERRIYPQGNLTAHVIGFTDTDGAGIAGTEMQFNQRLRDGAEPLELSIDLRVQHILRDELARQMKTFSGVGAAGVVLDANNGEVIAMVSLPDFHPYTAGTAPRDNRFNKVSLGVYEMGSTFKIFNTAMALNTGRIGMRSGYDATKPIRVARFTINDYHAKRRWLSVPEIFMYSSNIGSVKMALDVGTEGQQEFMARLGFNKPTTIELPERGQPQLPSPWREINTMTVSYGHGIAVSPLHLVSGVASIVNGGLRRPITLIKGGNDGVQGQRIISERTSRDMRRLLRLVVDKGTGSKAAAEGYLVGGKTGTSIKPGANGRYRDKSLLSSFVAAFPMADPRYVVFAMVDEPKGTKESHGYATGGWVSAPAVRRVIERAAPLLGIHAVDEKAAQFRRVLDVKLPKPKQDKGKKKLASF